MPQTISQENITSGLNLFTKVLFKRAFDAPIPPLSLTIKGFRFRKQHIQRYSDYLSFSLDSLPLPYLFVASQNAQLELLLNQAFPFKALGLVHRSIELTMPEPLDTLLDYEVALSLGEEIPHPKGVEFDVTMSFVHQGVEKALMVNRYFCFKKQPAMEHKPNPQPEFSQLETRKKLTFTESDVRGYAKVSGDYNPIHLHAFTAKPFGFKRPIAHGMYMLAKSAASLELDVSYLKATFHRPALLPIALSLKADTNSAFLINGDDKPVLEISWRE